MGFFSKVWKGVKKGFKKIGKGIKKGFKSFGKFMGKIGILGTIALTMLTGGLGIGAAFTNFGATLAGSSSALLRGAGWVIGKAAQFGTAVKSGFQTLTKGVTEFFGQTAKYVGNKLGMNIQGAPTSFLGEGGVWKNTSEAVVNQFNTFKGDLSSLASKSAFDPVTSAIKVPTPDELIDQSGQMPTPSADTQAFMDSPPIGNASLDPASISKEVGTLGDYNASTGGFEYNGQTLEANALVTDSTVPTLASDIPGTVAKDIASEIVETPSLLSRAYTSAKDNLFEGVTKAPGAVVTSAIVNKAMGTGDVDPYYGNTRVADFDSSYGIAGAVQQGFTPTEDPMWSQQLFDYDAFGTNQGGYGNVYANRMRGAMT
jgi:hypothetical protein